MAIASDSARQLQVLLLNGKTFGVDGAQVGVLEEAYDVGLGSFLECYKRLGLETKVGVDLLSDIANHSLEGSAREKHIHGLLIPLNLAKSDCSWLVVQLSLLLHATFGGSVLLDGLGFD